MKVYFNYLKILSYFILFLLFNSCKGKVQESYIDMSFPGLPDSLSENKDQIEFLRWEPSPILYNETISDETRSWISVCATRQLIHLFPNKGYRKQLGMNTISRITGVNHFLLDMDLVSHYVHPFTVNFYNRLTADDFVMRFTESDSDSTLGNMEFIRKKDVRPLERLGYELAFFRQWKLSELDLKQENDAWMIRMKSCSFSPLFFCAALKPEIDSHAFTEELPLWHSNAAPGWMKLDDLNVLGKFDGGNVVLIWEYHNRIWFQEMHGSLSQIINQALRLKEISGSEITLAISDAGPMSASFKSNDKNMLDFSEINKLDKEDYVGAGYGYFPSQLGVYRYNDSVNPVIDFVKSY
ncbi:MAG: hypothetical protein WED33_00700 [Bacteroidia bacterium]